MSRILKMLAEEAALLKQEWQIYAACSGKEADLWFSNKDSEIKRAKIICQGCPVRAECLNYALVRKEPFGVWGGLDEKERHRFWKRVLNGVGESKWTTGHTTRLLELIKRLVDGTLDEQKKANGS